MNVIFFWREAAGWNPDSWFLANHCELTADGRNLLYKDGEWIAIDQSHAVLNDYEQSEALKISSRFVDAHPFSIQWRGDSMFKMFIRSIPEDVHLVLDNDYGLVCNFNAVRRLPVESWLRRKNLDGIEGKGP